MGRTLFITGTDTGVGKTVLACLFVKHLREAGHCVAAFKPLCSGGRDDAIALRKALGNSLPLDVINPWHFRAPLAPLLAARRDGQVVRRSEVVDAGRRLARTADILVVEGAGGLLSPLGEDFNARDLIRDLRAEPILVCPNRLGAVNQALLVMDAFPTPARRQAQVVLVTTARPDSSATTNPVLLREFLKTRPVHVLPRLGSANQSALRKVLRSIVDAKD